jgi:hypothetical protein
VSQRSSSSRGDPHACNKQKVEGGSTGERVVYLTLVPRGVERRLSVVLSAPSVDRCTTVGRGVGWRVEQGENHDDIHAVENGDAQPTHACSAKNTHITASKRRGVRGAGESRRALSPWCHVALSGRLSGVLSAPSVDWCIIAVTSRWTRLWRGGQVSEENNCTQHTYHWGEAMGAAGWYGHGAGHPRQAVEAPTGQPNPLPPLTCAMVPTWGALLTWASIAGRRWRDLWCETRV